MRRVRSLLLAAAVVSGALSTLFVPRASQAAAHLEGVPRFDHVFTIVLENENYAATWDTLISRYGSDGPDGVRLAVVSRIDNPEPG